MTDPVQPVHLPTALASFDDTYSPRIVARVNDYDVRIAHTRGDHVWHVHEETDEFFLVLEGQFDVALRDADGAERTVSLRQGDTFVVPKGTEHKPSSPGGAILMFEPTGTSTTGDRHRGAIPDHVECTIGHDLAPRTPEHPTPPPADRDEFTFRPVHHVQLAIPPGTEEQCRDFWGGVLDMRELPKPAALAGRGGCWFRSGGLEIHLGVEDPFSPARKAHPGMLVEGIRTLARRLTDAGHPAAWDPDFPGHDRFYSTDPFGNRLEFLQAQPSPDSSA